MLDEVLPDDLRLEAEDIWVAPVHSGPHPVHVRVAEGFDTGEIFNATFAFSAKQRLVDAKVMAVAVDEYNRLFEKNRLMFQRVDELIEAHAQLIRSPEIKMRVRLEHQHDCVEILARGHGKTFMQPGQVGRVAWFKLRFSEVIRITRHIEAGKK